MPELAYREVYPMNRKEARRRLVQTYLDTHSIRKTARIWGTSRQVVRKWVRRYLQAGEAGLEDRSRRPHRSPRKTPPEVEQQVLEAWQRTGYGRQRLAWYLARQGLNLSPHTIRHILRRHRPPQPRPRRKPLYPAHWAWEEAQPLTLWQVDVKEIPDKGALGTLRVTHWRRRRLPSYQWTACEGRTRLRFLAYSSALNRTNGLAFLILVTMWLRAHGVETPLVFQTDWGQEFGGDNPERVQRLSAQFLAPLQARLARYPKGRKGYNGRVERSHRTDDEEFYRPYALRIQTPEDLLRYAGRWLVFYNMLRPHYGAGMEGRPPFTVLKHLGYTGPDSLAAFPPLLLDTLSTDLLLACSPQEGGNDLLAYYKNLVVRAFQCSDILPNPLPFALTPSSFPLSC